MAMTIRKQYEMFKDILAAVFLLNCVRLDITETLSALIYR